MMLVAVSVDATALACLHMPPLFAPPCLTISGTLSPSAQGFTRIDMKIGSLLNANEVNERHTDLVFFAQADLKGWIPGWALANAAGVQAYMVQRVQEHFTPTLTAEETTSLEQITAEWMIFMGAGRETVK